METAKIGEWAFLAGVIIALLVGLFTGAGATGTTATILVALGAIVGLINITEKQTTGYLVAAIALLIAGSAGLGTLPFGTQISAMLSNIVLFVAPAAVIVALKTVVTLGKTK